MTTASHSDPIRPPPPLFSAELWPHRSLSLKGFALVAVGTTLALGFPLFAIMGGRAFWVVAGFCALDLALLLGMIGLTYRSGRVRERVSIWPDRLRIDRVEPNGARRSWEANPYWVRVRLLSTRRIEDYLVLSASGRDVELGAFLTPTERRSLAEALKRALAKAAEAR